MVIKSINSHIELLNSADKRATLELLTGEFGVSGVAQKDRLNCEVFFR